MGHGSKEQESTATAYVPDYHCAGCTGAVVVILFPRVRFCLRIVRNVKRFTTKKSCAVCPVHRQCTAAAATAAVKFGGLPQVPSKALLCFLGLSPVGASRSVSVVGSVSVRCRFAIGVLSVCCRLAGSSQSVRCRFAAGPVRCQFDLGALPFRRRFAVALFL